MEYKVRNVMEYVVEKKLEQVAPTLDCCKCDQCMSDIAAYVLNRVPTKYVSTAKGELYSKTIAFDNEFGHKLILLIAQAAGVVKDKPRHEIEDQ